MKEKRRIPSKYSETVKQKIENVNNHAINVRFEKGSFKTSDCIIDGKKVLIINKSMTNDLVEKYLDQYISKFEEVEV